MLDVHKIALFEKINYWEDARLRRIPQKKQNIQKKTSKSFTALIYHLQESNLKNKICTSKIIKNYERLTKEIMFIFWYRNRISK